MEASWTIINRKLFHTLYLRPQKPVTSAGKSGVLYDTLAAEFDMSVRQIKKIVYRAEDKLFSHDFFL